MKKQIRTLTDIAAILAVTLVMAAALLPVGLMGSEEPKSEIPAEAESIADESESVSAEPSETASTDDAQTVSSETTTEATTAQTTTTTEETQPPATTQTTTAATTAQTTTQPPQSSWTEQEISGVMYVNTDGIYSREIAVIGSAKIRQYSLNEAVTVVALTDSDYYKLDDGTFIHSDYLSDTEVVATDDETETEEQNDDPDETAEETDEMEDDVVPLSAYSGIQGMALEMFDMTNEYRAQYGLPALQWDYSAYPAAQIRAKELLQRNSHIRPDGTRFSAVYGDIGYNPSASGENIVYYHGTARPAFDTLINSPSHRELILSSEYTHIAIAYVYDPNSYWGYYWVQEFTTP